MIITNFLALSKEAREQIATPLDFSNQMIGHLRGEALNAFCEALGQCRQVPEINLSRNSLRTETLKGLRDPLSKCKNLKSLSLKDNDFLTYHAILLEEIIRQCSALESLDLSGAMLDRDLRYALKCCPKLKVLILRKNWHLRHSWLFTPKLGSLLSKACPHLQILDISENELQYQDYEIDQLIALNKNLYEIRSPMPLTQTQSRRLENKRIQQAVERVGEIATEMDIPPDLALLTFQYDDNHVDEKTASLIKEGLSRLLSLKHALTMKRKWDVTKIFSLTSASFVLTVTLAASLPRLSWLMSTVPAAMLSSMVFKSYRNFIEKRNKALQVAAMTETVAFGETWYEHYQLHTAYNDGKKSVNSWFPYFRYCLLKAKCQLNNRDYEYWDKGYVEGLIEDNKLVRRERAAL